MLPRRSAGRNFSSAVAREIAEALVVEVGARGADDLELGIEQAIGIERAERGQQHALGKIAGRAEQQQAVGDKSRHAAPALRSCIRAFLLRRPAVAPRKRSITTAGDSAPVLNESDVVAPCRFPSAALGPKAAPWRSTA